jgi:N-acetyl-anhydromuramoyl-L-alanine amidase
MRRHAPGGELAVDADGWACGGSPPAERLESPNQDARPDGDVPSLVVVHNISLPPGVFGGRAIDALFLNTLDHAAHPYYRGLADLRVSSHFLVRRDGALAQFVSCERRAWHAGASSFEGRTRCNDFSIGIELEGDDAMPFDDAQYARLIALVDALCVRYPIAAITGHSDIAPGRKTDPGPCFAWPRVLTGIAASLRRGGP